jgi:hypothetical protein
MAERLSGIHTAHKQLSANKTKLLTENSRKASGPCFVECNSKYASILCNNANQPQDS